MACEYNHICILDWFRKYPQYEYYYDYDNVRTIWRIFKYSKRAFDSACANGHLEVLDWFDKNQVYGLLYPRYSKQAINLACKYGRINVLNWLVDKKYKLKYNLQAVNNACNNNQIDILNWLKNYDIHMFTNAHTCIINATRMGRINILQWFNDNTYYVFDILKLLKIADKYKQPDVADWLKSFTTFFHISDKYFIDLDLKYFIDSQKIFIDMLIDPGFLRVLNKNDIESIGTSGQTTNATNAVSYINKYMNSTESHHCFWAGMNARERAMAEPEYKTDVSYNILNVLFNLCSKLKTVNLLCDLTYISFAISKIYASQTTGIAKIFISSDKPSEKTGYTVGTNLWEAEFPVIWNLYHSGTITDIQLYIDDGILYNSKWRNPISIVNDNVNLPIYRRSWHYLDDETTRSSFVLPNMVRADYDKWRTTRPRNFITTTKLKSIILKWRK